MSLSIFSAQHRSLPPASAARSSGKRRATCATLVVALLLNLFIAPFVARPVAAAPTAQVGDLTPYVHPDGIFAIDAPTDWLIIDGESAADFDGLIQSLPWALDGFGMAIVEPPDSDNAIFFFFVDAFFPFETYDEWEEAVDDLLLILTGGEAITYLDVETDEETFYARMLMRTPDGTTFTTVAYGDEYFLALVVGGSSFDWDIWGDTINASLDTFTWDPDAMAAFLDARYQNDLNGSEIDDEEGEESGPILLPTPTPQPTSPQPSTPVDTSSYTTDDGLLTLELPTGFYADLRELISGMEVTELFPQFVQALIVPFVDSVDEDNVIALFFLQASPNLDVGDPEIWPELAQAVAMPLVFDADSVEVIIDEPDLLHLRYQVESFDATYFVDVLGDDGFVVMTVAGGYDWHLLEDTMQIALDSLTWNPAVVYALFGEEPSVADEPTEPEPTEPEVDEPEADEPEADEPEDTETEPLTDGALTTPTVGLDFIEELFLQQLEDPEGIFSAYAPARLQGESYGEWDGDVYSLNHALWAADSTFTELYITVLLAVMGPANQVMAAQADITPEDLPAPSLAVPSLEEWAELLERYESLLELPDDSLRARYAVAGDPYGALYYYEAESVEGLDDPDFEDEQFRIWTYITQQDGIAFIILLMGPLEEPDVTVHADAATLFPKPIDLGLESISWDLDVAKAALLERLGERYTPAELAALRAVPYADPLDGFSLEAPPEFTASIRTIESDSYSTGIRDPFASNGIFVRFSDLGESLSAEEWVELQAIIEAEFWPLVNTDPADPEPEVLAETVSTEDFNYAAYELVGTSQHGLFEFIEIDGLFAFAVAMADLADWDALEPGMRHAMETLVIDSDAILATIAQASELPATLLTAEVLDSPASGETQSDADQAFAPLVVRASFADAGLVDELALIVTGPDDALVGQVVGLPLEEVGSSESFVLGRNQLGGVDTTFRFSPALPWQPGPHTAHLYYAGELFGEVKFTVTGVGQSALVASQITDITLTAAGEGDAEAGIFGPDGALHYSFNLHVPAADTRARLFIYHEGELLPELIHTWHLPRGALYAANQVELLPDGGWPAGEYELRLWVNEIPWDVRSFTIDEEFETEAFDVLPLTPATAADLTAQVFLEPTEEPEYIDMVFVDGGQQLATLNLDEELVVYDTATWTERYRYGTGTFGWNLTTNSAGTHLAIAYQDVSAELDNFPVVVWDTATWEIVATLYGHTGAITALAFDSSGDWLVTAALDGTMRVWSLAGGLPTAIINDGMEGGEYAVTALDLAPTANRVALVYSDGLGEMWRLALESGQSTLEPLYTFEVGGRDAHRLYMFPAAQELDPAIDAALSGPSFLAVGGNEVQVWSYFDQVAELGYILFDDSPGRLIGATISADAQVLVAAGDNVLVIDLLTEELLAEPAFGPVQHVDISALGHVALLDGAGNIYILAATD